MALSAGSSVMGVFHPFGTGSPDGSSVPSKAAIGPSNTVLTCSFERHLPRIRRFAERSERRQSQLVGRAAGVPRSEADHRELHDLPGRDPGYRSSRNRHLRQDLATLGTDLGRDAG